MDRTDTLDDVIDDIRETKTHTNGSQHEESEIKIREKDGQPIAYFDSDTSKYYVRNSRAMWIRFSESSLNRLFRRGMYKHVSKKEGVDGMIEDHFIAIQTRMDVDMAIGLAGYPTGLHDVGGGRILVTTAAKYIKQRSGEWGAFRNFVESLLPDQVEHFWGWMKCAFRTLKEGHPFRPGQMLAIAGPAGCGKSLFQNIITELLGGRSAKPYKFMTGKTNFNSELFSAEHLMIEDEAASTNIADRRAFGANIKNMLVNETQTIFRKGKEALTVSPFWRMTCTLNDEPESLMVLPPLDSDLVDKVILLRASHAKFPFDSDDIKARKKFREKITSQLPAFLSFLASWRIPDRMKDQRFGVKAYQHPDILEALAELAPESSLLSLIDALKPWPFDGKPFVGTAKKLEESLLSSDKLGRVDKLLKWNSACGVLLGRLKKSKPERVQLAATKHKTAVWTIYPPVEEPES